MKSYLSCVSSNALIEFDPTSSPTMRAIWEGYAGWFHARSTTELYATPPESVHPDLVELAGGPEALAKRAREKLGAGAPVDAIHLAEVALTAAPEHRAALEASLAAHEALDSQSVNFWESSWLRRQIAELRGALGDAPGSRS